LPYESSDDIEELEEALDPEELRKFTAEDWRGEFPGYEAKELREILPERPKRWMPPVASSLMGIALGAAVAGLLIDRWPNPQQVTVYFVLLPLLAALFSFGWYWFFHLRPEQLIKKLKDEELNPPPAGPIHPS